MKQLKNLGFSLLEMLLVLAIMSSIIVMIVGYVTQKSDELRRDRAAMQIQMIQNAALAFYVNNSYWPVNNNQLCGAAGNGPGDLTILRNGKYLPPTSSTTNPWGNPFTLTCDTAAGTFTVSTKLPSIPEAAVLAGRFPFGTVDSTKLIVSASVTIPGQNLNNARSVNFANIYHSGACVPAPVCAPPMMPTIMVIPVAASGVSDPNQPNNVFPLTGFAARAVGKPGTTPGSLPLAGGIQVAQCMDTTKALNCGYDEPQNFDNSLLYWRVCLYVQTVQGKVNPVPGNSNWYTQGKNMGSVLAITRCAPPGEPVGHSFGIYQP